MKLHVKNKAIVVGLILFVIMNALGIVLTNNNLSHQTNEIIKIVVIALGVAAIGSFLLSLRKRPNSLK